MPNKTSKLRLVVLVSGSGSNLQAIIDACAQQRIQAGVVAVISNKPGVFGLQRAKDANIETAVLDHTQYANREAFDSALSAQIDPYAPDLVILAGFMRILTGAFVQRYQGRMLNIHPSLLPKFQGLHTHRRALEAGEKQHGASVHYVTPELDGGPVVIQAVVPVLAEDDATTLAERVLLEEHKIYPLVIAWVAGGRLQLDGQQQVIFDGELLSQPIMYNSSMH